MTAPAGVLLTLYSERLPDVPRAQCEATGCHRPAKYRAEFLFTDAADNRELRPPEPFGMLCEPCFDRAADI